MCTFASHLIPDTRPKKDALGNIIKTVNQNSDLFWYFQIPVCYNVSILSKCGQYYCYNVAMLHGQWMF